MFGWCVGFTPTLTIFKFLSPPNEKNLCIAPRPWEFLCKGFFRERTQL
jgi:hypothetical protein